ncbi:tRNA lysidine(34) synthetase TilS [Bacteroidales bacterium OttesenSCG-928-K22]|nr:tRNA lysidine(34) synthetase TilS [Bacteroidales bacterium OttesenSCG-928-L14]MDL2240607.1 tRNA lysidine(34) synthetase TilS [Bacteroidales bacterium OttesenSCG-928-K22]
MLEKFLEFIKKHSLINKDDKLLLSLSGGIDSVALFKLLIEAKIPFDVAHCNYHLRGEESNRDETFVTELCKKNQILLFVKHFKTEEFAAEQNISIEMAARDLRYDWYKELSKTEGYTKIATAHQLNDQAETFFINLIRNTGLNGICGIPIIRNLNNNSFNSEISDCQIIRPLLFASREDIVQYIAADKYVLDSTNETDNYLRNKIRHNIIPEFEKISPDFISNLQNSIDRFRYTKSFIDRIMENGEWRMERGEGERVKKIPIPKDFSFEELSGYLYFALNDFGFNFKQLDDIANAANNVGKMFISKNWELLVDREYFIVRSCRDAINCVSAGFTDIVTNRDAINCVSAGFTDIVTNRDAINCVSTDKLKIKIIPRNELKSIPTDSNIACLDYHKIDFPISVGNINTGDYFYPLGMNKKKKISDYFIDNKIDQFTKNTTFALRSSNNDILWLIGHRIDDRYKIDNETSIVLMLEID